MQFALMAPDMDRGKTAGAHLKTTTWLRRSEKDQDNDTKRFEIGHTPAGIRLPRRRCGGAAELHVKRSLAT